ncbi:MAG: jacalin-like lectin [Pseudomonadota bacterium]
MREVRVWSSTCINAMQLVLDVDGEAIEYHKHGGNGGHLGGMALSHNEYILEIYGRFGSYIDSLTFRTNLGQIRRFGGQGGHVDFIYASPANYQIIGFWGRAGHIIDAIGVHIAPVIKV